MRKITIRDSEKQFHTYRSDTDDLQFFVNDLGVEIVKWQGPEGERQQVRAGHFAKGFYMWVKEGDTDAPPSKDHIIDKYEIAKRIQAQHDPFTAAALSKDGIPPPPDFTTLRKGIVIETKGAPVRSNGSAGGSSPTPGVPGLSGDVNLVNLHTVMDKDSNIKSEILDDAEAARVKAQYDALAKAEKPKKKRIRPSRAKKKPQAKGVQGIKTEFPPAPVLAISADGKVQSIDVEDLMEEQAEQVEKMRLEEDGPVILPPHMKNTVWDPRPGTDDGLYPDPGKVLGEAEARYAANKKPPCPTCNDRGVVPDPSAADPLDTKACPDC